MKSRKKFSIRKNFNLLLGRVPDRGPDFFIAGMTRTGTTYLHYLLKKHPDIFMPKTKELNYFLNRDGEYHENLKKYYDMFYGYRGEKCIGEASPLYLEKRTLYDYQGRIKSFQKDTAIARIHRHFPDAKIIVSLRDPLDRIESMYVKNYSQGKIKTTIQEVIEQELAGGSNRSLLFMNRYDIHLKELFKYYPRKQTKILLFEDWIINTDKTLFDICSFIGVPYMEIKGDEETKNTRESYQNRNPSRKISSFHLLNDALKATIKDQLLPVRPYVEEILNRKVSWRI